MIDLETRMEIDGLIDSAYEQMREIFYINEETPAKEKIYQTMATVRGDIHSYFHAYVNYYMGVFEGVFITFYLNEIEKYPSPEEKLFIQASFEKKWQEFIDVVKKYAKKRFDKDQDD